MSLRFEEAKATQTAGLFLRLRDERMPYMQNYVECTWNHTAEGGSPPNRAKPVQLGTPAVLQAVPYDPTVLSDNGHVRN